jgi:hypothetical protein
MSEADLTAVVVLAVVVAYGVGAIVWMVTHPVRRHSVQPTRRSVSRYMSDRARHREARRLIRKGAA